jgi:hypothetical protein
MEVVLSGITYTPPVALLLLNVQTWCVQHEDQYEQKADQTETRYDPELRPRADDKAIAPFPAADLVRL